MGNGLHSRRWLGVAVWSAPILALRPVGKWLLEGLGGYVRCEIKTAKIVRTNITPNSKGTKGASEGSRLMCLQRYLLWHRLGSRAGEGAPIPLRGERLEQESVPRICHLDFSTEPEACIGYKGKAMTLQERRAAKRDWARRNREKCREARRASYARHREEELARRKVYYAKNREEILSKAREVWRQLGPQKKRERARVWREKNREKHRERNRAYYARHQEEIIARRRARKEDAETPA